MWLLFKCWQSQLYTIRGQHNSYQNPFLFIPSCNLWANIGNFTQFLRTIKETKLICVCVTQANAAWCNLLSLVWCGETKTPLFVGLETHAYFTPDLGDSLSICTFTSPSPACPATHSSLCILLYIVLIIYLHSPPVYVSYHLAFIFCDIWVMPTLVLSSFPFSLPETLRNHVDNIHNFKH